MITNLILITIFLYIVWMFITFSKMSNADYDTHRELLLHPDNDSLENTMTSISMGFDGKLRTKKRVSIGTTKLLLHKAWD